MRPIVSYYNHPLKSSLNITSRALAYILKKAELDDFNLWKTQDLNKSIYHKNTKSGSKHGKDTKIIPFYVDIKNMYNELLHDDILKTVSFVLGTCKRNLEDHMVLLKKEREVMQT